jgi:predicted transcriptional regulator
MDDSTLAQHLDVLGFELRWRIYQHLCLAGADFTTNVANKLSIPFSTASHNLNKLASVGLVHRNQTSTFALFSVNQDALANLASRFTQLQGATSEAH